MQRAIVAGLVRVDGEVRPKSFRLHGGERVEVDIPRRGAPAKARATPCPSVSGRTPGGGREAGGLDHAPHRTCARSGTLVNRLLAMGMPLSHEGDALRPGIVHRLDAGTQGLMVVAEDRRGHGALSAMIRSPRGRPAVPGPGAWPRRSTTRSPSTRRSGAATTGSSSTAARAARPTTAFDVQRAARRGDAARGARRGRAGRTRSACTSRDRPPDRGGPRATAGEASCARALGLERPFLHSPARSRSTHPVTGGAGRAWRSRCPADLDGRSRAPGATCDLDASPGPA